MKYLLSKNANVKKCNTSGWNALHHACAHGHGQVCEILIKAGASVKERNKFGGSPLNVAAASGRVSIVK